MPRRRNQNSKAKQPTAFNLCHKLQYHLCHLVHASMVLYWAPPICCVSRLAEKRHLVSQKQVVEQGKTRYMTLLVHIFTRSTLRINVSHGGRSTCPYQMKESWVTPNLRNSAYREPVSALLVSPDARTYSVHLQTVDDVGSAMVVCKVTQDDSLWKVFSDPKWNSTSTKSSVETDSTQVMDIFPQ